MIKLWLYVKICFIKIIVTNYARDVNIYHDNKTIINWNSTYINLYYL